jgi:phospholipid transport system substrate-binding protein
MRHFWAFLLIIAFAFTAVASEKEAGAFAQKTADQAVKILNSQDADASKVTKLENLFKKTVQTEWIGRFVLGKHWRDLSEKQQKDYLKNYKDFLVKQYTTNFTEYANGTSFEIINTRELRKNQYKVSMNIMRPSNPQPIKIDYRVRKKGGSFGIIDIVVEGISLLNTQRSEFSSVIQRKGIAHLIDQLSSKN